MMKSELTCERIHLGAVDRCYSVLGMEIDGEPCLFYGGDGEGSVQAFRGERFEERVRIWEGGGGTMSIVPFPGREGWTLISRGFYGMVECADSTIEIVRCQNGAFTHEPIAELPYLHRFDVLTAPDGARYILAASLHGGKVSVEDWSKPGHLYAGEIPADVDRSFRVELAQLPGDYYMNHGYCRGEWNGREAGFNSSREGLFAVLPPERRGADWRVEQLMAEPVSDIALCDIDGDGEQEIAALMPFHGNQFKIFHRDGAGYREVFSHSAGNEMYHAIAAGRIHGEPVFAAGAREGAAELFLVRWDGEYRLQPIEAGRGPSNVSFFNSSRGDLLLCANLAAGEAAVLRF